MNMCCCRCSPTATWQLDLGSRLESSQCYLAERYWVGRRLPSIKRGTKQCECFSNSPHFLATLMAVRMLSPVTITALIFDSISSFRTGLVLGFSLFSNIMNPTKRRSLSTSCRVIFWALIQVSFLRWRVAHPITR